MHPVLTRRLSTPNLQSQRTQNVDVARIRHLVLALGDQLNLDSEVLKDLNTEEDTVWMAEVVEEARHAWCHKMLHISGCQLMAVSNGESVRVS